MWIKRMRIKLFNASICDGQYVATALIILKK